MIETSITIITLLTINILLFFFLMIRRPPRSTLFPYTRPSDLRRDERRAAVRDDDGPVEADAAAGQDRKSTRLNSSHVEILYAVFCLKKKKVGIKINISTNRNTMISGVNRFIHLNTIKKTTSTN